MIPGMTGFLVKTSLSGEYGLKPCFRPNPEQPAHVFERNIHENKDMKRGIRFEQQIPDLFNDTVYEESGTDFYFLT